MDSLSLGVCKELMGKADKKKKKKKKDVISKLHDKSYQREATDAVRT